jgi:prepilin-type N-terminal cleavage/methylation domain-containing protein
MRAERGVTLIELMVSVAVASVVILAATQAVMVVTQAKRTNQRRLEVNEQASGALSLIGFDAQNAGYRFASPAFSVRVLDNVVAGGDELGTITATGGCGGTDWGIAPGSDTVEFRYGFEQLVPGNNSPVTCTGGTCDVVLGGGAASNPFSAMTPSGAGDLVLLSNATAACLGRVTANVTGTAMQMQLLNLDLSNATVGAFPGCAAGTFSVMRLGRRVRYLVCQPPASQPLERPGLYRQEVDGSGDFGAPQLVQEGIEDLQVALRYDGTGATPILTDATKCDGVTCVCNHLLDTAGQCAWVVPSLAALDSSAAAPLAQRAPFLLRGLEVGVTAISTRGQVARGTNAALEQFVRPALLNHAAGTALSGDLRSIRRATLSLPNISVVTP